MEQQYPTVAEIKKMSIEEVEAALKTELPLELQARSVFRLALIHFRTRQFESLTNCFDKLKDFNYNIVDPDVLMDSYRLEAFYQAEVGDYQAAFHSYNMVSKINEVIGDKHTEFLILTGLSSLYRILGFKQKALETQLESFGIAEEIGKVTSNNHLSLGANYIEAGYIEEGLASYQKALEDTTSYQNAEARLTANCNIALYYLDVDRPDESLVYIDQAKQLAVAEHQDRHLQISNLLYAKYYAAKEDWEGSLKYGEQAFSYFEQINSVMDIESLSLILMVSARHLGKHEQALYYAEKYIKYHEIMTGDEVKKNVYSFQYQMDMEKKEAQHQKELGEARLKTLAMLAGEMAHEIQNPLQFVNNFSQMNLELLDDLDADPNDADARMDLRENCEKIQEHGQRISKIVAELQDKTNKAQAGELELPTDNVHDFSK